MEQFLRLEGAYLILGGVILLITLFVGTRPFMPQGSAKKGLMWVMLVLVVMIALHYRMTIGRMDEVKEAFAQDKVILCESRMLRKVAQTVRVQRSNDWKLEGENFTSPHYQRAFFTARCIVE